MIDTAASPWASPGFTVGFAGSFWFCLNEIHETVALWLWPYLDLELVTVTFRSVRVQSGAHLCQFHCL
jgi:hypothetical protein